LRLPALVEGQFGFKSCLNAQTDIEVATVIEVDGDFGTVVPLLIEGERTDHFASQLFALDHDLSWTGIT